MKKAIRNILVLASLTVCAASCNDVLNITPTTSYSSDVIWSDSEAVDHYVYGLYAFMKNYCEVSSYNQASYTDAYADVLKSGSWNQYNHSYNTAMLQESSFTSTSAGAFECWDDMYSYIRRCNELLRDAPDHTDLGATNINTWTAETRFIRALAYMRLMMVYGNDDPTFENGGVVLRTVLEGPEMNDKARSTWDESWDVIIEDLEFAARKLPDTPSATGRLGKAAGYGMLSRAALYSKRWERCISAADSCKVYGGALADSYKTAISSATNAENLIAVQFTTDGKMSHRADVFFRPVGDMPYHSKVSIYGVIAPTSELVDSYEMADGTDFDWSVNGSDPYSGREPRFYASILYNGCEWEGRTIETFVGGTDGRTDFACTGTTTSTPTGYYFRKFITENETNWETYGSSHFAPYLRYSEVLLNKAEAYAELGEYSDACEALNEVRARVGLPGRSDDDYYTFMEHLRNERLVELAGEGRRFWDLRRWKLAESLLNGTSLHGVDVKVAEDGTATYTQISVDADRTRVFPERYYAFSIPETERNNNTALGENNPGW